MPALYQRARPVRFGEVVGQEHVIDVLGRAVRVGRIGHAYLFSGPRGVGKTTTARLLAMAANCENEDAAARPCGVCESCRLVQAGAHPDVTELDAASNNSVEDVRDLREKVGLAALRGGMRVWILDEAHMLSRAAANALLKTLEEPPPGLLFVLATTEPEKLPPTILSRCQHFRFRRLSDDEIEGKLASLCQASGTTAEEDALRLVARVADGGMRDAESMLERLMVLEGGITAEAAEDALGLPPQARLQTMATALAVADLAGLLTEADALYRAGFSPRTLAEQLGRTLRDALVGSVLGEGFRLALADDALMHVIQALDEDMERFVRHDDLYALEVALIKALNAASHGGAARPPAELQAAPGAEAAPDRAPRSDGTPDTAPATVPDAVPDAVSDVVPDAVSDVVPDAVSDAVPDAVSDAVPEVASPADPRPAPASEPSHDRAPDAGVAAPAPERGGGTRRPDAAAQSGDGAAPAGKPLAWREVKAKAGPQLKAFLKPAKESLEGDVLRLRYDDVHKFHHGQLLAHAGELAALLERVAGPGYTVLVEGPEGSAPKKIA